MKTEHKRILLVTVHLTDFDHKIVDLPEDHRLVTLAKAWKRSGQGEAYVQLDDDSQELINAWWDADKHLPSTSFPAHVDYIVYGVAV